MDAELTVKLLEEIYLKTVKATIPRLTPDFQAITRDAKLGADTVVYGERISIEEFHIGYIILERWSFVVESKEQTPIEFMVELLPGIITQ